MGGRLTIACAAIAVASAAWLCGPALAHHADGDRIYYVAGSLTGPTCPGNAYCDQAAVASSATEAWSADAGTGALPRLHRFDLASISGQHFRTSGFDVATGGFPITDVALATDGNLWTSTGLGINRVSPSGTALASQGPIPVNQITAAPGGGAYTSSGDAIQQRNSSGATVGSAFGAPQITSATDIVFGPDDTVYVCDEAANVVHLFHSTHTYIGPFSIGGPFACAIRPGASPTVMVLGNRTGADINVHEIRYGDHVEIRRSVIRNSGCINKSLAIGPNGVLLVSCYQSSGTGGSTLIWDLDRNAPSVQELLVEDNKYVAEDGYTSGGIQIRVTPADPENNFDFASGIPYEVSVDGGTWGGLGNYGDYEFPAGAAEGAHRVQARVEDGAGHVSPVVEKQVILDRTAPTVKGKVKGTDRRPKLTGRGTDQRSGVAAIEFAIARVKLGGGSCQFLSIQGKKRQWADGGSSTKSGTCRTDQVGFNQVPPVKGSASLRAPTLPNGYRYQLLIRARDRAGNTSKVVQRTRTLRGHG